MKKITTQIDLLGVPIGFEENGSSDLKTFMGGLLSLAILIATIVLGFLFGKEIYQRKNPNVSYSQEFLDFSQVIVDDFPMIFNINFGNGTFWTKDLYESVAYYKSTIADLSLEVPFSDVNINACTHTDFPEKYQEMLASKMNCSEIACFCIKNTTGLEFHNEHGEPGSKFLNIQIKSCVDSETNTCHRNRDNILNNVMANFFFLDTYVDSQKSIPIQKYVRKIGLETSNSLQKRYVISFINNEYISDNGWILEAKETTQYVSYSSSYISYNIPKNSNTYLSMFTLDSPRLRTVLNRNYMKVQELFAKIGGLINALTIIMKIISYHFLKYYYYLVLNDHITKYESNNNNLDKSDIKNNENTNKPVSLIVKHNINNFNSSFVNMNKLENSNINFNNSNIKDNDNKIKDISQFSIDAKNNDLINNKNIINKINSDIIDLRVSSNYEGNNISRSNKNVNRNCKLNETNNSPSSNQHSNTDYVVSLSNYFRYLLSELFCCRKFISSRTESELLKIENVKRKLNINNFSKLLLLAQNSNFYYNDNYGK